MSTELDLSVYRDLPGTALIMGGNWDPRAAPDELLLSPESMIRMVAFGVLAKEGIFSRGIITAGLTRGPAETPEAEEQHRFLDRHFRGLEVEILEEGLGHTTRDDAVYTRSMLSAEDVNTPKALITTKDYAKRQAETFEEERFSVVPVVAEPIAASYSAEWANYVRRYQRSGRRIGVAIKELGLKGLKAVNLDNYAIEKITERSRPYAHE